MARSGNAARYALAVGLSTKSTAPICGRMRRRASSRILRRSRLRATAVAPYRGTTNPSRGCPDLLGRQNMSILLACFRCPLLTTALISEARAMRQARGSPSSVKRERVWKAHAQPAACDPSSSADSTQPYPSVSSCAPGSRACSCAAGCAAYTLVSSCSFSWACKLAVVYGRGQG